MTATAQSFTSAPDYLELYKYLLVLSEEQIVKLRKIAIGILSVNAFSEDEIHVLETKMTEDKG